ncbi:MAG: hypothetical protein QMD12_01855 [Candidatus Aenigmarchaeota archaeon]|nr:hypothetical protein [Candidatus Aenigmarchaeota archaeon]
MKKGQVPRIDEFAFVLLAGLIMIIIMMVAWSTLPAAKLEVYPESISSAIQIGSSKSFTLTLNGTATNVSLSASGEIKNWIYFDKNNFDVSGIETVKVFISVPSTVIEKVYSGSIVITFSGGRKTIPVNINATKALVVEASRSIFFNDFSISYAVGSETLASKENVEVVRGYFANYPINLVHESLAEEKFNMVTGGYISLVIDDTNSAGNLIIEFNGEVIYNQKAGPGSIDIRLEKEKIKRSNTITISADLPGWKFWMNTVYKVRSAKFGIGYQGVFYKDFVFELGVNEVTNFRSGVLTFRIKNYTIPLGDITIKINDKTFFRDIPPLAFFSKTFNRTEVPLNIGTNLISFSTEPNAFYDLRDVTLTITYRA